MYCVPWGSNSYKFISNSGYFTIAHLPNFIEKVIVLVGDAVHHVLACLVVVLEDDGNVHVDNYEKTHDKVDDEVADGRAKFATVPVLSNFRVRLLAVGVVKYGRQCFGPASACCHLEKQDESLEESFEVVDIVESWSDLHILEETDAKDGKDEHDEEEKEADVEQGRKRHPEGKEQCSNSLGAFDQTQDSAHLN